MSDSPFKVGDVVVFNPEFADVLPWMQSLAEFVQDSFFGLEDVMVVENIRPASFSESGWLLDTVVQGDPGRGTLVGMDSNWFIRKE